MIGRFGLFGILVIIWASVVWPPLPNNPEVVVIFKIALVVLGTMWILDGSEL